MPYVIGHCCVKGFGPTYLPILGQDGSWFNLLGLLFYPLDLKGCDGYTCAKPPLGSISMLGHPPTVVQGVLCFRTGPIPHRSSQHDLEIGRTIIIVESLQNLLYKLFFQLLDQLAIALLLKIFATFHSFETEFTMSKFLEEQGFQRRITSRKIQEPVA